WPNYEPIWDARSQGRSAGPYQNPRLMLVFRNVQITNQFGTVNLVVWPDLCHPSQIARKIRRPISESAADVGAQTRSQGGSAGPYQNPRLMLLLRNVQITNQFGTVNLVVWPDLCRSSQIARKIRRPISESAADVGAQSGCNRPGYPYFGTEWPNYEPIWHARSQGRSAGPYQNPQLMLLLRLSGLTCAKRAPTSQMARKIRRPISESAADVAAQKWPNYEPIWDVRWLGGSASPYQNPRLMLLLRNGQITNQFGTVNLVVWPDLCHSSQIARKIRRPISESAADVGAQIVWPDLCHSSQIARKIRRPISESAADVAAQKWPNYEPIWDVRWLGGSAGPYQNPRLMLLLRLSGLTCAKRAPTSQMARRIRRPISESAADVAAQKWPNYEPIWDVRWLGGSAGPYQNPRLMLLLRLSGLTCAKRAPTSQMARRIRRPISESAADVAAQKWPNYEPIWDVRWLGGSAGPYQNPRLMLLLRNVQITNQFGTVNLVVWPDLCHSSQIARKIRRPISESAADVAAQIRWLGRSAGPYQNPRLMLLLRLSGLTCAKRAPTSQMARRIRQPISESAADVAAQKWPNYEPIWDVRWLGGSAGPYQNPRLMLLLRLSGLTCAKRAPTSQMARRIRRPISESAADVAAQKWPNYEPIWDVRWLGGSAGPYQNPRLMLLLRLSGLTCATPARSQGRSAGPYQNPRLMLLLRLSGLTCAKRAPTSQMARKIRRPISESAADVAAQKWPNYEPIWDVRWLGGSAGPYQNPRLMLLLRNVQITNQFGTVNLVVWPDLCHSSQIARKIRRPISESAADVAAQIYGMGRTRKAALAAAMLMPPSNGTIPMLSSSQIQMRNRKWRETRTGSRTRMRIRARDRRTHRRRAACESGRRRPAGNGKARATLDVPAVDGLKADGEGCGKRARTTETRRQDRARTEDTPRAQTEADSAEPKLSNRSSTSEVRVVRRAALLCRPLARIYPSRCTTPATLRVPSTALIHQCNVTIVRWSVSDAERAVDALSPDFWGRFGAAAPVFGSQLPLPNSSLASADASCTSCSREYRRGQGRRGLCLGFPKTGRTCFSDDEQGKRV
ncbi:hypothetical protein GGX14DRAFT_409352, partial [Mycena pura]